MSNVSNSIADRELNSEKLADAYERVRSTVIDNFDERVWFMTDACLSVIATLKLKDLQNPVGLNLVDGPSSEKTTVLSFFYGPPFVYRSDDFTPASFVSQAASLTEEGLKKVDLLPRIRHKCLIIPELAPVFGADKEDLQKNFSMLTRVFDGEGLWRDGGVHGGRGYRDEIRFAWLGATTPIRPQVWKVMGNLGSRFLFLHARSTVTKEEEIQRGMNSILLGDPYKERVRRCRAALRDYLAVLLGSRDARDVAPTVDWDRRREDYEIIERLTTLAHLAARGRSAVELSTSGDNGGGSTVLRASAVEGPMRLVSVLYGLARGHALLQGRTRLTEADLPVLVAVAFSSIPEDRRSVIELLVEPHDPRKGTNRGVVTSAEIEAILDHSRPTARGLIETLAVLGIGKLSDGVGPRPLRFEMDDQYSKWLCTDDFLQYHQVWATDSGEFGGEAA